MIDRRPHDDDTDIEALVRAAGEYVRPSVDLRPRVVASIRDVSREACPHIAEAQELSARPQKMLAAVPSKVLGNLPCILGPACRRKGVARQGHSNPKK